MREVFNGFIHVLSTVQDYDDMWNYDGTLKRIHQVLFVACRKQAVRPVRPPPSSTRRPSRARNVRTVEATWTQIGHLLGQFTAKKCKNYLLNSSYGSA